MLAPTVRCILKAFERERQRPDRQDQRQAVGLVTSPSRKAHGVSLRSALAGFAASDERESVAEDVVAWENRKYPPCSLGLFVVFDGARDLLKSEDKLTAIRDMAEKGKLSSAPVPDALARPLAASGC